MIAILIIAHGSLGENLLQCAAHVLGARPERASSIDVIGHANPDALLEEVRRNVAALDDGSGVLILTDMIGGTPANVATRALVTGRVEGLAGVSLPMLLRALNYRSQALAQVVVKAEGGGHQGIQHIAAESSHAPS